MNTVIYVDQDLMTAIAAKRVGLLREDAKGTTGGMSLNWLIQSSVSTDTRQSISRDVRELLPEDVVYMVYDHIEHRFESVRDCINGLADTGPDQLLPGSVISVQGVLSFPDTAIPAYDPFSPPTIDVRTFSVHGQRCFVGRLSSDGFSLPLYFIESAKDQICFCNNEPVEVIGVARWSPPYRPGGSKSLTKCSLGGGVRVG